MSREARRRGCQRLASRLDALRPVIQNATSDIAPGPLFGGPLPRGLVGTRLPAGGGRDGRSTRRAPRIGEPEANGVRSGLRPAGIAAGRHPFGAVHPFAPWPRAEPDPVRDLLGLPAASAFGPRPARSRPPDSPAHVMVRLPRTAGPGNGLADGPEVVSPPLHCRSGHPGTAPSRSDEPIRSPSGNDPPRNAGRGRSKGQDAVRNLPMDRRCGAPELRRWRLAERSWQPAPLAPVDRRAFTLPRRRSSRPVPPNQGPTALCCTASCR